MWERWQQQLSLRDQAMLALLGGVLLLYLVYQLLWHPLAQANLHLQQQNAAAANSLNAVTQMAVQLQAAQQGRTQAHVSSENLTQLIDRTVAANQLHMSRFQPGSAGDVQVRLDNAPFDQVLRWLNELESGQGVTTRELVIAQGSAPGIVNVSVRLYRP